jgi:hypothetical protein
MHEIITVQLGQKSNYLATHFWNTQVWFTEYAVHLTLTKAFRNHISLIRIVSDPLLTMMCTFVPELALMAPRPSHPEQSSMI